MSAPMSPERLAEIAARWGAVPATESPRLAVRDSSRPGVTLDALHHARTDVPALLAEVERLRAELAAHPTRAEVLREAAGVATQAARAQGDSEMGQYASSVAAVIGRQLRERADEQGDSGDPTPLRWGLDDVEWGADDSVTLLLSGPHGEPYVVELDADRAAALRDVLAGGYVYQPTPDPGGAR